MEGEGFPLASVCKRSYAIPSVGENLSKVPVSCNSSWTFHMCKLFTYNMVSLAMLKPRIYGKLR